MENSKLGENSLLAITVLHQYEDLGVQREERFAGFLTSPKHAMYMEHGELLVVAEVRPTNDPSVFLALIPTLELGRSNEPCNNAETVQTVAKKLNRMTAYEFVTEIMLKVRQDVNFGEMIIPANSGAVAALESGVA